MYQDVQGTVIPNQCSGNNNMAAHPTSSYDISQNDTSKYITYYTAISCFQLDNAPHNIILTPSTHSN